ncbi:MAG: ATPase V, partial [bacterium]|nr:ATPase V [bacterium]
MSIVPLVKVTICGHLMDKVRVLADLQEIGCLHLLPLTSAGQAVYDRGPSAETREALKFLLSCPHRRRQMKDASKLNAVLVEKQALKIRDQVRTLKDERDYLRSRIKTLLPWGDFLLPPSEERAGYRLWFY